MAINTQTRRRSTLVVLPVPDGSILSADRRHVTWNYSGLATTAVSPTGPWYNVTAAGGSWNRSPVTANAWVNVAGASGSWTGTQGVPQ